MPFPEFYRELLRSQRCMTVITKYNGAKNFPKPPHQNFKFSPKPSAPRILICFCILELGAILNYVGTIWFIFDQLNTFVCNFTIVLKYGSEEKGSSLYECSILLGFIMSTNLRGLWFYLLIKVQNATSLVFWHNKTQEDRAFIESRTLLLRSIF